MINTLVTFENSEGEGRVQHMYPNLGELVFWLTDQKWIHVASELVEAWGRGERYGTVGARTGEVRLDWRDTDFVGEVAEDELTQPQSRLLRMALSAMREIAAHSETDDEFANAWTFSELQDLTDANMLGTLGDDVNLDVSGNDWVWMQERVQEWLWQDQPGLDAWDRTDLSLGSFRAFLRQKGAYSRG